MTASSFSGHPPSAKSISSSSFIFVLQAFGHARRVYQSLSDSLPSNSRKNWRGAASSGIAASSARNATVTPKCAASFFQQFEARVGAHAPFQIPDVSLRHADAIGDLLKGLPF